jgi:hypothetical protein
LFQIKVSIRIHARHQFHIGVNQSNHGELPLSLGVWPSSIESLWIVGTAQEINTAEGEEPSRAAVRSIPTVAHTF